MRSRVSAERPRRRHHCWNCISVSIDSLVQRSGAAALCVPFRLREASRKTMKYSSPRRAYLILYSKAMACHNNLPHCHIKTAARTDFIGKYGLPLSKKTEKSFGNLLMTNRTCGKECWRSSVCKLCHPSSKSGRFIWRCGNHYSTKHKIDSYNSFFLS